jgi:hypothetical protein
VRKDAKDAVGSSAIAFTYDLMSGRKVPLTQAQFDALERRSKLDALCNMRSVSDLNNDDEDDADAGGKRGRKAAAADAWMPVQTMPEWPGRSTGSSVEKWLQRKLSRNDVKDAAPPPEPRHYPAYNRLEQLDLVIAVEHCHNCEHHNMTLRHDPKEYLLNADTILRALAETVHGELGGVARSYCYCIVNIVMQLPSTVKYFLCVFTRILLFCSSIHCYFMKICT